MDSLKNRATSALLGALIGDAAGATLEFLGRKPTASEVTAALELPGGGYWKLNPGQITDDGELTLALARALESSGSQFSIAAVARSYANWIESKPFDLGQTISKAFAIDTPKKTGSDFLLAKRMRQQARGSNFESKANGSLMRAVPLAIWGHRLPNSQLAQLAFLDSELSHPNPSCKDAVACYLIALAHLLNTGNRESAFEAAYNWVLERESEPTSWLEQVKVGQIQAAHPQAGFVKIAFQRAFHHLPAGSNYLTPFKQPLMKAVTRIPTLVLLAV